MGQILDFFEGRITHPSGRTFDEILALDDQALERAHDVVQWIFPLPEPSKAQPNAPYLSAEELTAFRESPELQAQVVRAARVMAGFYVMTTPWRRPRDHNHLRITRIIRCLTLIEQWNYGRKFFHFANEHTPDVPDSVKLYWAEALNENSTWFKP